MADFVVHEGSDDSGLEAEAFPQAARGVVFAAAFPCGEIAGGADPAFTGVKTEHDFPERNLVEGAFGLWFDDECHGLDVWIREERWVD